MKTTSRDPFLMHALAFVVIVFPLIAARAAAPAKKETASTLPTGPAVNLSYMERTVRPGDDFYQYANGEWIKHTEIPGDRGGTCPPCRLSMKPTSELPI